MLSILSTPYILPTSSIKSSIILISVLLVGTETLNTFLFSLTSNFNFLNTSSTSSTLSLYPNTELILSSVISISLLFLSSVLYSSIPLYTFADAYIESKVHALSIAK